MSSTNTQQYLICPITLELFNDPVIAEDGNTYEREAITAWITQHGTSPITRKCLSIDRLTPNRAIKDTVEAFKEQNVHIVDTTDKRQNLRNLDVLCRYCGLTQQLNSVKEHQLRCSSNPANIASFDIADNENIFTLSQQSSSNKRPFHYGKALSFANPLANRSMNSNQTSISQNAENGINTEWPLERRLSLLKSRKIRYVLAILLAIILATIGITLTIHYVKRPEKETLSEIPTTFNSTSTIKSTSTTAFTTTTVSTTNSAPTTSSTRTTVSTTTSATILTTSTSSTSTTVSTTTPPTVSTTISSSVSTVTSSSSGTLCPSAEWSSTGITVISDLYSPHDIAIDSQDNIIVADTENHLIKKYFTNGTNMILIPNIKAIGLFIDQFDNIYAADAFNEEVKIFSSNGELITTIDGSDIANSTVDKLVLNDQSGLYVDKNNTLYISDTGNDRIVKYFMNSTSGIVVAGGRGPGSELNQLNTPSGIFVDEINEIGAIYICDKQNRRIQKWLNGDSKGITVAANDKQLHTSMSILLHSTTEQVIMYISSFNGEQVLKWVPYAQEAQSIVVGLSGHLGSDADQLSSPRGIKFDKYWNLFVADSGNDRIEKFLFNTSSCASND